MPFLYRIAPEQRIGVLCLRGAVAGIEIVQAVTSFYADEDWQPGFSVLWDTRSITRLMLAPEDADAFTRAVNERVDRIGPARTAVVTAGFETYMSGLLLAIRSRKFSGREIELFSDFASALEWLRVGELPPALKDVLCP